MAAGDLRFYRSSGDLADTLIADVTGPYVHVDIDMGDGTVVGELSSGLQRYTPPTRPAGAISVYPTAQHTSAATLHDALVWVLGQAHTVSQLLGNSVLAPKEYGWSDILDAALHRFTPATLVLGDTGEWDCSDFVARFALRAGLVLVFSDAAMDSETRLVTPTALAEALGVK